VIHGGEGGGAQGCRWWVRLEGTNVELGKKILGESGLNVVAASDMADGAKKIVELSGKASS